MFSELLFSWRKGAAHKYIRRKPYFDKKGRKRYRYTYKEHHAGGVTSSEAMVEGSAYKLTHKGKAGHFHIQSVSGDKLKLRHDESGGELELTRSEFQRLLHLEHGEALGKVAERAEATLKQAKKTGSAKQIKRAEAEARKLREIAERGKEPEALGEEERAQRIEALEAEIERLGAEIEANTISEEGARARAESYRIFNEAMNLKDRALNGPSGPEDYWDMHKELLESDYYKEQLEIERREKKKRRAIVEPLLQKLKEAVAEQRALEAKEPAPEPALPRLKERLKAEERKPKTGALKQEATELEDLEVKIRDQALPPQTKKRALDSVRDQRLKVAAQLGELRAKEEGGESSAGAPSTLYRLPGGGRVEIRQDQDDNRIRLFFPGKPSDDQRARLKKRGFRWSPRAGAWQRQLTENAVIASGSVLRAMGAELVKEAP